MLLEYRDRRFWPAFQQAHWKPRVPTVLRQPFGAFPFTDTMVLAALKEFLAGVNTGDARFRYLLDLDGKQAPHKSALKKLARADAPAMADFEAACAALVPGKPFGLMVNNLQSLETGIWDGVTAFLQDAHPYIDFPVARAVLDLFFGNYARSFLGLHKDSQEIFGFVVRGDKTILAWPFEYFAKRHQEVSAGDRFVQTDLPIDYRPYRKDAIVLHAKAGDVFYWGSEYWHVAEGEPGRFSLMLSLGLFLPQMVSPQVAADLARFRERWRQGPGDYGAYAAGEDGEQRLRWATGLGFRYGAPYQAAPEAPLWRRKPCAQLVWRVENGKLLVASQGYSALLPADDRTIALLEALARGETVGAPRSKGKPIPVEATFWDPDGELGAHRRRTPNPGGWLVDWLASLGALQPAACGTASTKAPNRSTLSPKRPKTSGT